jgi:DNA-binding transcriptional regulator YiaG
MSACATSVAGELGRPAINVGSDPRASSVDAWIGTRVRIKRTSSGMSQQEFCKLLDIDRTDLPAFEAGVQRISANLLLRIAKLLDARPDYFFRGYVEVNLKGL